MPRPPRVQLPGGIYHLVARGNRRGPIYLDGDDFALFLGLGGTTVRRYGWTCHAYCLMPNHFHLLVQTEDANLSDGMHRLNSCYAHAFNERHGYRGHVFEARFGARVVDSDAYLGEVARYIVLNPVRAGLCDSAGEWRWSSYAATSGWVAPRPLLNPRPLLRWFGPDLATARLAYEAFVRDAVPRRRP
jgi:putative transposase